MKRTRQRGNTREKMGEAGEVKAVDGECVGIGGWGSRREEYKP